MARRQSRPSVVRRAAPRQNRSLAPISKTASAAANNTSNPITKSTSGGVGSGLISTMASGMAFGTGSAMAHRAVDAVMGGGGSAPHQPASEPQQTSATPMSSAFDIEGPADYCKADLKAFQDCLAANGNSMSSCKFYFDMLQQCQLRSPQQPGTFSYGSD